MELLYDVEEWTKRICQDSGWDYGENEDCDMAREQAIWTVEQIRKLQKDGE